MHGKMQPAKIVLFNYSGVVICFSEKCPQAKTTMYTRRVNGYNLRATVSTPMKHRTLVQCCFNAGAPSAMMGRQRNYFASKCRVCSDVHGATNNES